MQKSNSPTKLAIKIVLLLLAVFWIGSIFYPSAPTPPENISEYVRSERELGGLEAALSNLKAGAPLSGSYDFSDWISPSFKWIVRENKDVLTISSVADRGITFNSPLPPDTNWLFGSWSPDSTALIGMDCLSCMETDTRYLQLILFEVFPEQKKSSLPCFAIPISPKDGLDSHAPSGDCMVARREIYILRGRKWKRSSCFLAGGRTHPSH